MKNIFIFIFISLLFSCKETKSSQKTMQEKSTLAFDQPPQWAKEAIWYQIFVERFRNGNENSNPNLTTMKGALIDEVPNTWSLTPWTHDWYKEEEWAKASGLDFYRTIQMRRYGGDLQGVKDKISYLKKLGINAVYFNPLNDAPSLHKYDARNYHHIDVTFGNDRDGDMKIIESENPGDPSTWKWTNADKLFLEIIELLHAENIKVVLDFSWNHTGTEFWAFRDIKENGAKSKYKDWYEISIYDNPETSQNEFDYSGWFGIKSLPELKKIRNTEKVQGHPYEGNIPEEVKKHIYDVCKRWMDPNGNGDLTKGIDGMRLDVAEHIPLGFWRDFRKHVRSLNPEFYLVGENWWTKWPDELMNPEPWVQGDVFDAVMHYHWFKPARAYINQGDDKINLAEFYNEMERIFSKYRPQTQHAMMNLISSHDAERVLSSLTNGNKYKFNSKPSENKNYHTGKPDAIAYEKLKMLLIHQFTFVGSPHIWNGDEMGMWGADDPDNRKPLWWEDMDFENENPLYKEQRTYNDKPKFNNEVFEFYSSLCQLRNKYKALRLGICEFDKTLLNQNIFSYTRSYEDEKIVVIINCENNPKILDIATYSGYKPVYSYNSTIDNGKLILKAYSGIVLKKEKM